MCRQAQWRLAPVPSAPREGRTFVAQQCLELGMPELAETAKLLASELVTNAVIHTGSAPLISVASTCGELVVEVVDSDPRSPAGPKDPAAERGEAAGGRGLTLVSHLADDWGFRLLPDDGKAVWFALRPPVPPAYSVECECHPTHRPLTRT